MNFFGHAVVAHRRRREAGFVLGAMLPDFAAMAGARARQVHRSDVAEGVAFHHRTDAVFHSAPTFRALLARGTRSLAARGVHRGGSMGAAHVGVELLLDGALVGDEDADATYLSALDVDIETAITWDSAGSAGNVVALLGRLSVHGIPDDYRQPDVVARRVARALARRPRLALRGDDDVSRVRDWLAESRSAVADAAPQLLSEVWTGLLAGPGSGTTSSGTS